MDLPSPYLLFLGNATDELAAKTAKALFEWAPEKCLGQISLPECTVKLSLPELSIQRARSMGAASLVIGCTAPGGSIHPSWHPILLDALKEGLHLINGLHEQLASIPILASEAAKTNKQIIDLRQTSTPLPIGKGLKRQGKRLLTVGTDCSIGKMYTSLCLYHALKEAGVKSSFRATGQTGMMIAGSGVAIDAVIADFIAGAAEQLSPGNEPEHWDIIEGQGSIMHPSFSGVSLGLLHGSQPDAIVLCHEPTRTHMRGLSHYPMPSLQECLDLSLSLARITNPEASCLGISVNTSRLNPESRKEVLQQIADETGLLAVDPKLDITPLTERIHSLC
ncbi:MAG: DUF1611 domain-containing protein [Oligoflexales bacterium]|nr:DUF1611 domain-containing protein [Oligoflexales bacterium]